MAGKTEENNKANISIKLSLVVKANTVMYVVCVRLSGFEVKHLVKTCSRVAVRCLLYAAPSCCCVSWFDLWLHAVTWLHRAAACYCASFYAKRWLPTFFCCTKVLFISAFTLYYYKNRTLV